MRLETFAASAVTELAEGSNFRRVSSTDGLVDFSSNDYLGLANCEEIREQLIWELRHGCPVGSTGSRLISGNSAWHTEAENYLAKTFGFPSALLYSSGYAANIGVLSAFSDAQACFFSDQLNHASLIDGMRLNLAAKVIYRHNDMCHLDERLSDSSATLKIIVTESVFSMDGDLAPIEELIHLARKYQALLIIDEAHATGVFGQNGLGCLSDFDFDCRDVDLISIHTGGKALGAQGAFVLSSQTVRDFLINKSRSFIYSTALAPLSARQLELAMRKVVDAAPAREALWRTISIFRNHLGLMSGSQILPIQLGSNLRVLEAEDQLRAGGFAVKAIRSPTVSRGTERLRVTLKSFHTLSQVKGLINVLEHLK